MNHNLHIHAYTAPWDEQLDSRLMPSGQECSLVGNAWPSKGRNDNVYTLECRCEATSVIVIHTCDIYSSLLQAIETFARVLAGP